MIHGQLPLPVPCYDFTLITDLTLGPQKRDFGYCQLSWCDGRLLIRNLIEAFPPHVRISRIRRALMHFHIRENPSPFGYYDSADF